MHKMCLMHADNIQLYIYNWVAWNQFFVPTDNFDWCYNWLNDASNGEQIQGEWIKKHEIAMQFYMIFSWG